MRSCLDALLPHWGKRARALETRRKIWPTMLEWILSQWVLPQWGLRVCHQLYLFSIHTYLYTISTRFFGELGWLLDRSCSASTRHRRVDAMVHIDAPTSPVALIPGPGQDGKPVTKPQKAPWLKLTPGRPGYVGSNARRNENKLSRLSWKEQFKISNEQLQKKSDYLQQMWSLKISVQRRYANRNPTNE